MEKIIELKEGEDMNDEDFKKHVLKSLLTLLTDRLETLEDHKKYNSNLDKEILNTRNYLKRYKDMLEEMKDG